RSAVSQLLDRLRARIDPVMLENLDYPGRNLRRAPEEFGAGEFHRAHDFPGRKRQVADRTPNTRKLAQQAEKLVERAIDAARAVFLAGRAAFERGQVRGHHVPIKRKAPTLVA